MGIACFIHFPGLAPALAWVGSPPHQVHLVPWFIPQICTHVLQISWVLYPHHNSSCYLESCLLTILLGHLLGDSDSVCWIYCFCSHLCSPTTDISALLFMFSPLIPFIYQSHTNLSKVQLFFFTSYTPTKKNLQECFGASTKNLNSSTCHS